MIFIFFFYLIDIADQSSFWALNAICFNMLRWFFTSFQCIQCSVIYITLNNWILNNWLRYHWFFSFPRIKIIVALLHHPLFLFMVCLSRKRLQTVKRKHTGPVVDWHLAVNKQGSNSKYSYIHYMIFSNLFLLLIRCINSFSV